MGTTWLPFAHTWASMSLQGLDHPQRSGHGGACTARARGVCGGRVQGRLQLRLQLARGSQHWVARGCHGAEMFNSAAPGHLRFSRTHPALLSATPAGSQLPWVWKVGAPGGCAPRNPLGGLHPHPWEPGGVGHQFLRPFNPVKDDGK